MTEAEWLACPDPAPMLAFLRGKASDRKLRLFGVACCRRIREHISSDVERGAVDLAESYADGKATSAQLAACRGHLPRGEGPRCHAARAVLREDAWAAAAHVSGFAVGHGASIVSGHTPSMSTPVTSWPRAWHAAAAAERAEQFKLVRCIFGDPFRLRPVVDSAWLGWNDRTVPKLAEAIYEDRRFEDLPVLADALQDAGCTDAELLGHLRGPGPHARGCWALDLLLGKE